MAVEWLPIAAMLATIAGCGSVTIEPSPTGSTATETTTSTGQGGSTSTSSTASNGGGGSGGTAPVETSWQHVAGDASWQQGASVAVDGAGNVIVSGTFNGSVDLGGGPLVSGQAEAVFVAKLDHAGHHLWSRSFENAAGTGSAGVAVDAAGNILLAGDFRKTADFGGGPLVASGNRDVFVAKLAPDGAHLWSKSYGDPAPQRGGGVAVDAAGNAYVTGSFLGTVDFGSGPFVNEGGHDVFVLKLGPDGSHVWSRRFGADGNEEGKQIAVSPTGAIAVTGTYDAPADVGGGELPGDLMERAFVLALDAAGNHAFSRGFNGTSASVMFDASGNLVLATAFYGNVDFGGGPLWSGYFMHAAVAKYDTQYSLVWDMQFGLEPTTLQFVSVAPGAPAGGDAILLVGAAEGPLDFGGGALPGGDSMDAFVAKLDGSGQHLYSRRFAGQGITRPNHAAVDGAGNILFTGDFTEESELVTGPIQSQGNTDFFVAKLVP